MPTSHDVYGNSIYKFIYKLILEIQVDSANTNGILRSCSKISDARSLSKLQPSATNFWIMVATLKQESMYYF